MMIDHDHYENMRRELELLRELAEAVRGYLASKRRFVDGEESQRTLKHRYSVSHVGLEPHEVARWELGFDYGVDDADPQWGVAKAFEAWRARCGKKDGTGE